MLTLACGPYFSSTGIVGSILLLTLGKPLVYWFFILAFRYRVSTPTPMSRHRAGFLALLRALIGIGVIGLSAAALYGAGLGGDVPTAWGILIAERALMWLVLGYRGAHLRGRRLLGWTLSGIGIDIAFDVTVAASVFSGAGVAVGLGLALAAFLVPLFLIGRRPSLTARFLAADVCCGCGYDLTGNVSGICPECGLAISASGAATP